MADYLDNAFSQRLGQRPAHSPANILRVADEDARPANASHGQVAYTEATQKSWIWNADALGETQVSGDEPEGAWEPFGGGIEFYAQDTPPTSAGYAAFWLDTSP